MAVNRVSPRTDSNAQRFLVAFLAACLASQTIAAGAQDVSAPPTLEDLIPDSAVERPDEWATQGVEPPPGEDSEPPEAAPAFSELEIAEPALPDVAEPDSAGLATIVSDQESPFADLGEVGLPPLPELEQVRIDRQLVLDLPADRTVLPERDAFIDRFRELRKAEANGAFENGDANDNVALQAARLRATRDLLERQLRVYGFYNARVVQQADRPAEAAAAASNEQPLRLLVLPGERYRFGAIDLGQMDAAPDRDELRQAFAIASGDPLLADRIVSARNALATRLGETGYPFASLAEPELLVDHERAEGDLTLAVEPGGKYVFGEVTSSRPEFLSGRHLARIARFEPGEIYQRSLVQDLRQAIQATGLVSSINVEPRAVVAPAGDQPGELALDVSLEPGRLRTIAGAIGYGSEDGVKVEASWENRNLFPPEGALKIRGILGTREQLAGIGYRRNNFRGRDQLLSIDAYASDILSEAVDARSLGLRGSFERYSNLLFQKPFSWQLGAEVVFSDERNREIGGIARPRQEYLVGSLFGRATFDRSDSLLDPKRGFRVTAFVAPEYSRSSQRNTVYLRGQLDASIYQPAGKGVTLAGRMRLATIQGAQTFEIAPSRRLYAGGGASVRGYGYQAVGPRNDFGEPTGGRSLVELSAEARVDTGLFDGALQVVPFFDLGAVSIRSTPDFRFVKYGAGVGVRYETGFGPIRVDLGVPLNRDKMFDSAFAVYVSLGQAF